MKKLLYILLLVPVLSLHSCLTDDNDVFDNSSNERLDEYLAEWRSVLTGASNGWVMEVYPHEERRYGGFVYLVDFKGGDTVIVSTERSIGTPDEKVTSLYQLVEDFGPMLTFNEYNKFIHEFAEGTSGMYQGYKGDYEFMLMPIENRDVLEMRGKKSDNIVTLKRLSDEYTWEEYINEVINTRKIAYFGLFNIVVNNQTVGEATRNGRIITYTIPRGQDYVVEKIPFTYTDDGIDLYEPISINGANARNFRWDAAAEAFISTDSAIEVVLQGYLPDDYGFYDEYPGRYRVNILELGITENNVRKDISWVFQAQLTANPDGETYTLTSDDMGWDWHVEYNAAVGGISITSQLLGEYMGNALYLCATSSRETGSGITWSATIQEMVGMNGVFDKFGTNPNRVVFSDNGESGDGDKINGYSYNLWDSGGYVGALFDAKGFDFSYVSVFLDFSMTKLD